MKIIRSEANSDETPDIDPDITPNTRRSLVASVVGDPRKARVRKPKDVKDLHEILVAMREDINYMMRAAPMMACNFGAQTGLQLQEIRQMEQRREGAKIKMRIGPWRFSLRIGAIVTVVAAAAKLGYDVLTYLF